MKGISLLFLEPSLGESKAEKARNKGPIDTLLGKLQEGLPWSQCRCDLRSQAFAVQQSV